MNSRPIAIERSVTGRIRGELTSSRSPAAISASREFALAAPLGGAGSSRAVVAAAQSVGGSYSTGLLAERAVDATRDVTLLEEHL